MIVQTPFVEIDEWLFEFCYNTSKCGVKRSIPA